MKYYVYEPYEDGRMVLIVEASNPKDAARKIVMSYAKEANMNPDDISSETEEVYNTHIFVPEDEVGHIS